MTKRLFATAYLCAGLSLAAAIASIFTIPASLSWMAAGYSVAAKQVGSQTAGDEADWLMRGAPRLVAPAAARGTGSDAALSPAIEPPVGQTRSFAVGTRLTISGAERLALEVVSVVPAGPETGLVDGQGRPLLVVTARERNGVRLIRLLVEADRSTGPGEQVL